MIGLIIMIKKPQTNNNNHNNKVLAISKITNLNICLNHKYQLINLNSKILNLIMLRNRLLD